MPRQNHILHFTFVMLFLLTQSLLSQVGLGVIGSYKYPGLQSSQEYDIHFDGGVGYGFYVKHDLLELSGNKIHLRYLAIISKHDANLPGLVTGSNDSQYRFSNLSVDILYEFFVRNNYKYYTGLSVNLLQTLSEGKFRATYSGTSIYPAVFLGWSFKFAEGFDSFAELQAGYGKTDAEGGPEEIPITGISLFVGLTMYLSE